jgi:hypothetical protein
MFLSFFFVVGQLPTANSQHINRTVSLYLQLLQLMLQIHSDKEHKPSFGIITHNS